MSKENQVTEWKQSWHDDYYKWICGYANAYGGTLFVGKDDKGVITGVSKIEKLLEDIPNKTVDILGIMIDVNQHEEGGLDYLEIVVEPYPYPVNLRGRYYFRSGSTKKELKGAALNKFLLGRLGKRWDGVPVPNVSVEDLKIETLDFFREKSTARRRLESEDLEGTHDDLIEALHLKEDGYLKRAAILLFHPNPEKYVTGAYIKIGFFESDDNLKYDDEVHGNLFEQSEKALGLLRTKYNLGEITYEEGIRQDNFNFPEDAIREALFNAVSHKDYSSGIPIQISVYHDKIIFWNEGQLPEKWTVERLTRKHPSKPFNPDIANTLFRSGYIESWGRGTIKMIKACKEHKIAPPRFSNEAPDFQVELIRYSDEGLMDIGMKKEHRKIILYVQEHGSISNGEVQKLCDVSKRTATRYLTFLEEGYLINSGSKGVGSIYVFKGAIIGP